MKQNITAKQFTELKNKSDYLDWCRQHGYYQEKEKDITGTVIKSEIPLLSIGQMIEFLSDNFKQVVIKKNNDLTAVHICTYWFRTSTKQDLHFEGSIEICDVLWEAVKEVLEK